MAITKITTPELIDLPFNNTDGIVLAKGTTTTVAPVQYLVVAGGGGGGWVGGGGGAGGLLTATANFDISTALDIIVGDGGLASTNGGSAGSPTGNIGGNGSNSTFDSIVATGGGGGGSHPTTAAASGGSGGGAPSSGNSSSGASASPSGQGNAGGNNSNSSPGYGAGGGGGAGAVGAAGTSTTGGNGGVGLQNNITGTNTYYAGGGGGAVQDGVNNPPTNVAGTGGLGGGANGSNNGAVVPTSATPNTGGGGGGGGTSKNGTGNWIYGNGSNGGSGVIILKLASTITATFTGGVTFTLDNTSISGQNIYRITATTANQTVTFSVTGSGTGRPSTAVDGEFRYNTTTKKVEYYDGANWFALNSSRASGQPFNSFNPVIYTGNGSTQNITTGFNPDFGMFKARDAVGPWSLQDSVSGNFYFRSNASDAGAATNGYNVTSWTTSATEITVKDDTNGGYNINGSPGGLYAGNGTYVGYVWKAGGAATTIASGTNGSTIASDVSANIGAGFSIVKYTTAGTQTISHGLSEAPQIIINKISDASVNWNVYTQTTGTGNLLKLNLTDASASDSVFMTAVGANTFTTKWSDSTYDYINYCWHSVPGFSKIGSYTWTGTSYTAGTMVTGLGFTPSLVMIKSYSAGNDNWFIFDNKRVSGTQSYAIYPNLTDAERTTGYQGIIFDSDGFSAGAGADGNITGSDGLNLNGRSYIYMAFAAE